MNRLDPLTNLIEDANQHCGRERTREATVERIARSLETIADCFVRLVEHQEGKGTIQ